MTPPRLADYAKSVCDITDAIVAGNDTRRPPLIRSRTERCAAFAVMPCWCGPCILWSTLWRAVACPVACFIRGPAGMCTNNGCTSVSDSCVVGYVDAVNSRRQLPLLSAVLRPASPSPAANDDEVVEKDKTVLAAAVDRVQSHFNDVEVYGALHYALVRHVVVPLVACDAVPPRTVYPSRAAGLLADLRTRLSQPPSPSTVVPNYSSTPRDD